MGLFVAMGKVLAASLCHHVELSTKCRVEFE
jgi:hypothetical protein